MNEKKFSLRLGAMFAIAALVFVGLVTRLAFLQLVQGSELASQVSASNTRTYPEIASRGEILDRDGDALVSNALGFFVQLDYYELDKETQNETLLNLSDILQEHGFSLIDELPVSTSAPFTYTYSDRDSGDGLKLYNFIEDQEGWPQDPDALELFSLLCEKYDIPESWGIYDKRTVVGIRYYLDLKEFSSYNNPITITENVDIDTVSRISELDGALPGVQIQVDDMRQYDTPYAAHILGRVGIINSEEYAELKDEGYGMNDIVGKDGMEKTLESYLRGTDGVRAVEVSSETGQVSGEYMIEDPDPGDTCYLTIDLDLQKAAEDSLAETIDAIRERGENRSDGSGADVEGGSVVVLDANSGEVLAMASYPTYSLATYSEDFATLKDSEVSPYYNRAIAGLYAPGSTFKILTSLAALEEGIITTETKIRDRGIYTVYEDYQPRCWLYRDQGRTHGNINVSDALKYSCNYFFYEVGRQLGIEKLNEYASLVGLGQLTGIELSGERAGQVAGPASREENGGDRWWPGETLQAAIGQSDNQFTPLQIANYVATVINGGTHYRPHLLKKVVDYTHTETIYEKEPEVINTIDISASTLDAIKEGMRGVVTEDGTASSVFRNFPIEVGGKTGSAQTSANRSAHGVFVSFAPYDDPEIVVCVVGEYAGSGGNVAPVCIAIYNEYFGLVDDEDQEEEDASSQEDGDTVENPVENVENPDDSSLPASDAETGE